MFRKFLIKKDERGLLFRKGDFVTVLRESTVTSIRLCD